MCARMIAFYIMGPSMKTLRNALFVNSTDSIIKKMVVMMRTTTETEEKCGPKKVFWYFPIIPHLKRWFANKEESKLL
jgi:GTP-dependent phosphoenolpyruvate carboxykinase